MCDDAYTVLPGPGGWRIYAVAGSGATILEHSPFPEELARQVMALMNHAHSCGMAAGDRRRVKAMRAVLSLRSA